MTKFSRRQFNRGAAAAAGGLAVASFARPLFAQQDPLKVGFIYVGPISDHGWSYQHDIGRLAVEEAYGDRVETSYVENVPEGADAERVINQMAASGHGLIFTTSFGFMNPTAKVAQRFPKVLFEHATGYKRLDNLATYAGRFYEGRTVSGRLAGHMTKSGIIGYIGSFPIPEVVSGINAFTLALREVKPDAEVRVVWVNTWYDPGKEADAAKALIDQGADVIATHTDSPAAVQTAQERGVYAFGQDSDMSKFGPDAHLTAIINNWAPYYVERVGMALDGTWKATDTWGGLASEMVQMAPLNPAIPQPVQAEIALLIDQIKSGEVHSFTGPIVDQSGTVRIPEGRRASDQEILTMDYFVEGVVGTLPK